MRQDEKRNTPSYSFWEQEAFLNKRNVIIIGSGIVGLSAAIYLKKHRPEWSVLVIEKGPLPKGGSTKNAGFACFGSITELLDDLEKMPSKTVWSLVEKRWNGLRLLRQMLGDKAIDFVPSGNYEVFQTSEDYQMAANHIPRFNEELFHITGQREVFRTLSKKETDQFKFKDNRYLLLNQQEGQLHPGKMIRAFIQLAQSLGVEFLNGIAINQIDPLETKVQLYLQDGTCMVAEHVLVATNGFARSLLPDLPVFPARNQVLITAPVKGLSWKGCFHMEKGYFYFRNVGNRILLGGGRHLAKEKEQTEVFGTTPPIRQALTNLLHGFILPGQQVEIEQWWSGILGVGMEKSPIIKHITPNLMVAVRMGGMGVAIGSLVGKESAEMLCNR